MLSSTKKCGTVALRELFMGIVCLATLSFLLTYQLGQSGIYVDSEETRNKEFQSHGLASSDSSNGKIFGRSLNMHDAGTERAEQRPTSLLSRLLQLEEKLLEHTRRHKIGVAGLTQDTLDDDDWLELQKTARRFGHDIAVVGGKQPVSKTDNAFIQSNYSMILCAGDFDSCPESFSSSVGDFQRMNRVSAIEKELCDPAKLCKVLSLKENAGRAVDSPCHTVSRGQVDVFEKENQTFQVVVAFDKSHVATVLRDSSVSPLLQRERSSVSTIWTIGEPLLTFLSGPLLRLRLLVASFSPLRVYLYPTATIGPVDALVDSSLFQDKVTYEEILQYVGEKYGLSASSQWWNTIQILLMKMLVAVEELKEHFVTFSRCTPCFGAYNVDVLCTTVRQCYIIQMKPLLTDIVNYKHILLEPILHLMTSERMVAMDVAIALDELRRKADIKVCEDDMSFGCLSDNVLIYFLENRRETLSNTGLIKMYPTTTSSIFTPFLSDRNINLLSFNNPNTARLHPLLMSLEVFYSKTVTILPENIDVSDDVEMYGEKLNLDYLEPPINDSDLKKQGSCSEDPRHYKELAEIQTEPAVHLQKYSLDQLYAVVDYDVILIEVWASARHCCCQVRLGDVFEPSRPTNFTLGLGENIIKLLIVDTKYQEPKIVKTVKLSVVRESHNRLEDRTEFDSLTTCSLKQDCALPFSQSVPCGLQDTFTPWGQFQQQQKSLCTKGDVEGSWTMPCTDCRNVNSCYWKLARWQPDTCNYRQLSEREIQQCLVNKNLLFLGDSTNRGIMHYIIEKINGSLYTMDKTHTIKVYPDLNGGRTNSSFAYYPHFWLPAKHRPKFHKVLYQLIKRSFPLANNTSTVLVMGGVHWLAKRHIDVILEALKRLGLSAITKVVKGIGAGFHQNIQGVRYVNKENQAKLLLREQEVLHYAKRRDFQVLGTFNMTMARYKDFTQGKCACHFHKISKEKDTASQRYRVEGDINAAYSQILLHNICNLS